ncbi:hypothetical protein CHLNCDRAFT_142577 [Chlorella variabilis]|uniref:Transcription elongation factor SPT5 n=1 Tax=Chlorella variabilis TaxID=554065 RepID=E1ZTX8_CHLVA|nr:hypothetical protein CHLNCDRAFT_142577 [Chlorella variabilis]EFN50704.1 hypothetical protein CHLNCDRAFT_142577 [Chlorella variabilis]|eukprot:XP_005842816.1 hypothetical protein CHLNCDRAFT_142577 [Chlorella variabilis]
MAGDDDDFVAGGSEEEEEEYQESEEAASDDEDEEDVGRHRKKAAQKEEVKKPAKGKKKKRSGFIDDAAEEEEDGRAGRKRLRASAFIDDIAGKLPLLSRGCSSRQAREVDDDEDEDDMEASGCAAARRWAGARFLSAPRCDDGTSTAVGQQALMPTPTDPKLWVVRCGEGQEREAVTSLLQKCYDLARKGSPLLIKAVFCQDHLKAGSWVRIKNGLYKGDLAKVVDTDPGTQRGTIKVVPRLDLAALASRKPEDAKANFGKQPKVKPPAKPFNPDEARSHRLDVVQHRDRTTGDVYLILNGNNRFLEGYLIKTVALKSLELQEALPPLDELQKFNAAAQSDEGGGTDLASLVQTLQAEGGEGGGAASVAPKFEKGDRVLVVEGDLKNIQGRVQLVTEDGGVMVTPEDAALPDFRDAIRFEPREVTKYFESGEHVKVIHGQLKGETGMVWGVEGPFCYIFTDATQQELRVFTRDLTLAVATSSSLDSLGGYEMHDLVVLDNTTVGVIVNVEQDALRGRPDKPDIRVCRLPDIKRKMMNKRASVKDGAGNDVGVGDMVDVVDGPLKGRGGTVRYIMRGFVFVQTREVSEHAGFICLQARHTKVRGGKGRPMGGGVGMTPGRSPAYGSLLASPHPSRGMQQNVLASPGRQGGPGGYGGGGPAGAGMYSGRVSTQQDKMLEGRSITIKKGPFRGMRGRVISATATHVRLELEAQMKTVTVDRSHLALEDGGRTEAAPRPGYAYPAAPTPMAAGGRTPMHPGIHATPAHYSSHTTPAHPGMTPGREALTKTPAYDAAWAATPAHPGVGGGGGAYPNAGTPAFADTPGTVNPSPGGMGYGAQYAPSPAAYAPSPAGYAAAAGTPAVAGTPGMPGMYAAAGTPGMYAAAGTPGVYGAADMPAPTPGGGQGKYGGGGAPGASYRHWAEVEVVLPGGERAAVRSVEGGTATVAIGAAQGDQVWSYPADAPTRSVAVGDMQLAPLPVGKSFIRVVGGELAGQYGQLVGTDSGDGIVRLGADIKIIKLAEIGRLAVQPPAPAGEAGDGAPPPPPPA